MGACYPQFEFMNCRLLFFCYNTSAMNMDNGNPHRVLTREQKTGFVLLLIFGILAIGLGILQMRNTIFGPFVIRLSKTNEAEQSVFLNEEARLQSIDTDRDGLNDYEELSFYETSPYLPDTDSDGIDDKVEIEQGTDPLCAKGELCEKGEALVVATTTLPIAPILSANSVNPLDALANTMTANAGVESVAQTDQLQKFLTDPAQIRTALLQGGTMTKAQLDKVDDATLMKLVDEILQEQMSSATTTKK